MSSLRMQGSIKGKATINSNCQNLWIEKDEGFETTSKAGNVDSEDWNIDVAVEMLTRMGILTLVSNSTARLL
jgi:hypothetical protein